MTENRRKAKKQQARRFLKATRLLFSQSIRDTSEYADGFRTGRGGIRLI